MQKEWYGEGGWQHLTKGTLVRTDPCDKKGMIWRGRGTRDRWNLCAI